MAIVIRNVTDLESINYYQDNQRLVWGSPPIDIVPTHVVVGVLHSGGGLICAYDDERKDVMGGLVGGTFWWLGVGRDPADPPDSPPRLKACSHMASVLPEYQSHGIGMKLKLAQRQAVLDQGLTDWITWTYDPLYRRNAVFNIRRLGATTCTFARNIYGDLPDAINAGWPSDRVTVDWRLNSPRIPVDGSRPDMDWDVSAMAPPAVRLNADGMPQPPEGGLALNGDALAIPLPGEMRTLREADPSLALEWRMYMRYALETAFAAGYIIVDCVNTPEYGWRYILTKDSVT